MLHRDDLRDVAERFGVGEAQVRRDHLISHLLAAVSTLTPDVVFFGGTALSRTHLPDARLSEDVDLYASDRRAVVRRLTDDIPRSLRREFPRLRWDPPLDAVRQPDPAVLVPASGLGVRVQVLDGAGYALWPTERRAVEVRYRDVAPVTMVVPTRAAFVGMKVAAWHDRRAARDLYDLWALATTGAVDAAAAAAFRSAVGYPPRPSMFDSAPADDWQTALGRQTGHLPPAEVARRVVRDSFSALDSP